jgi:hypothetical protein
VTVCVVRGSGVRCATGYSGESISPAFPRCRWRCG